MLLYDPDFLFLCNLSMWSYHKCRAPLSQTNMCSQDTFSNSVRLAYFSLANIIFIKVSNLLWGNDFATLLNSIYGWEKPHISHTILSSSSDSFPEVHVTESSLAIFFLYSFENFCIALLFFSSGKSIKHPNLTHSFAYWL